MSSLNLVSEPLSPETKLFHYEEKFLVVYTFIEPEVRSPEADLRPRPSIHIQYIKATYTVEKSSGQATQFNI
jgi:hypothetical protein